MMRVRLSNGVILDNIPEGMSQEDILRTLKDTRPDLYRVALNDTGSASPKGAEEGVGPVDAAMIAAGGTVDWLYNRAKGGLLGMLGDEAGAQAARANVDESKRLMAPLEEARPVATALGSALPYAAIPTGAAAGAVGRTIGAIPGLGRAGAAIAGSGLADAALTGAAIGAAEGTSPVGGAAGGVAGYGAGRLLSRVISPVGRSITETQQRLVDRARRIGMSVKPSQATGSPFLERLEASMESSAITAGAFARRGARNQATANRLAARAIGETSDSLNADVMGRAAKRIGDRFDELTRDATVKLDDDFITALGNIEAKTSGTWVKNSSIDDVIERALKEAAEAPDNAISARRYQDIRSQIGKAARSNLRGENSDPETAFALFDIQEALDDALSRSLGDDARQAFAQAREQWRILSLLERPGVVNTSSGDVSLRRLANSLRTKDKRGFARGRNRSDLYDAARFAQGFRQYPDSGTAGRLSLPMTLGMQGGIGGLTYSATGSPEAAAAAGLLSPLAARGLAGAYASGLGGRYLSNGLLTEPLRQSMGGLLGRVTAPMGGMLMEDPLRR